MVCGHALPEILEFVSISLKAIFRSGGGQGAGGGGGGCLRLELSVLHGR